MNSLQKCGDLLGASTDHVEGKDDFGKFQGRPIEGSGIAIASPRTWGTLKFPTGPTKVKRSRLSVAIGLGGMVFQGDFPFFLHEGLQEFLDRGLDPLFHFLRFSHGFCSARWPSILPFPSFSEKATMLPFGRNLWGTTENPETAR